jgi:hypothetical protein
MQQLNTGMDLTSEGGEVRKKLRRKKRTGPEIVGALMDGTSLQFALRMPGDSQVTVMDAAEVRMAYPVELSKYYERHVHFM